MTSDPADATAGLTAAEVAQRLRNDGFNELPSGDRRRLWIIATDVLREPMFALLLACGAIYLLLGDRQEALILLGFVVLVAIITVYQEQKTERALEALRDLSSPRALVIRDGVRQRIPGREVVQGDVLVLSEGDRVPADAVPRASAHVSADESLLTGESVPVRKVATDDTRALGRPGGEDLPFVFAGTLITRGRGLAEVLATGPRTEMGRIGKALATVEPERSALQRETARLVRRLLMVAVALCVIVVVAYDLTRADWLSGFLAGLTLAMAILPNEFPAVLAIFLALGAWRISQKNVLTRRIPALEALGSATVLCVDKTGTLTQNRMSVVTLASGAASSRGWCRYHQHRRRLPHRERGAWGRSRAHRSFDLERRHPGEPVGSALRPEAHLWPAHQPGSRHHPRRSGRPDHPQRHRHSEVRHLAHLRLKSRRRRVGR